MQGTQKKSKQKHELKISYKNYISVNRNYRSMGKKTPKNKKQISSKKKTFDIDANVNAIQIYESLMRNIHSKISNKL